MRVLVTFVAGEESQVRVGNLTVPQGEDLHAIDGVIAALDLLRGYIEHPQRQVELSLQPPLGGKLAGLVQGQWCILQAVVGGYLCRAGGQLGRQAERHPFRQAASAATAVAQGG